MAALLALVLTPFNFTWMVASNPATAGWLRQLDIDPSGIWWSLLALLAVPMALGLLCSQHLPALTDRHPQAAGALQPARAAGLHRAGAGARAPLLNVQILPQLGIVVLHNAAGLALGWAAAMAFRVSERDRRAVMIEGGMQNAGLALGIIAVQFNADLGMVIIASLWGIWHIVSGMSLALLWRRKDARLAH